MSANETEAKEIRQKAVTRMIPFSLCACRYCEESSSNQVEVWKDRLMSRECSGGGSPICKSPLL